MMQEQEIVRLEMRLKEEEIERLNVSKQLDQQRKAVIEKDKLRMKQQGEIYILNERIAHLEESNDFYKNETESNINKLRERDYETQSMREDLISMSRDLEIAKNDATSARFELKQLQSEKSNLHDEFIETEREAEELRNKLEGLEARLRLHQCFLTVFFS